MVLSNENDEIQKYLQSPDQWPDYSDYEPLDPSRRHIRLLSLSLAENDTRTIHIKSFHVSLDNHPEYEALSYYWGPPDETRSIVVNGKLVQIRRSIYSFLWEMCARGQTRPIWLDSLCINQCDVKERNWQVSIMGDIYRSAARVNAWIGETDLDSEYALGYMKHCHDQRLLQSQHHKFVRRRARQSLEQVLYRPYWRRVWIVQELALAKNLMVYCGNMKIEWSELIQAGDYLFDLDEKAELTPKYEVENGWTRVRRLADVRISMAEPEGNVGSLWDTAYAFRDFECQNLQDKIYGFLGLSAPEPCVKVDYSQSLVHTFFEAFYIELAPILAEVAKEHRELRMQMKVFKKLSKQAGNVRKNGARFHLWTEQSFEQLLLEARSLCTSFEISAEDMLTFLESTRHEIPCITYRTPAEISQHPSLGPTLRNDNDHSRLKLIEEDNKMLKQMAKRTGSHDTTWTTLRSTLRDCRMLFTSSLFRDPGFGQLGSFGLACIGQLILDDIQVAFLDDKNSQFFTTINLKPELILTNSECLKTLRAVR